MEIVINIISNRIKKLFIFDSHKVLMIKIKILIFKF